MAEPFAFIDLMLAQKISTRLRVEKESVLLFLSTLCALSRLGHLCVDLSDEGIAFAKEQVQLPEGCELLLREGAAHVCSSEEGASWVARWGSLYYLPQSWECETRLLTHVERLFSSPPHLTVPSVDKDPLLNVHQQEAVDRALAHSLSFLTGGPGTGKTFTAACIVKCCAAAVQDRPIRVILTAPTGKAAFHLASKLTNCPSTVQLRAGTLHSLLRARSYEDTEVLPLFAELILVDECSMIDARLFARLLSSIQEGTRVVFLGDKHQLPPVETGSVFADLLETQRFPSTVLEHCLRSDSEQVLSVAEAIQTGNVEALCSSLGLEQWWALDTTTASQCLEQLWARYGERFFSLSSLPSFAILSCMRQGPLGVERINTHFLNEVLARSSSWATLPVMVTQNQYDLDLYNGDIGVLHCRPSSRVAFKEFGREDFVIFSDRRGEQRRIHPGLLSSFSWSYAISVHKSQGSEFDEVVVLIPPGSELFGREILYTAVTRAKKRVIVASTKELVAKIMRLSSRKLSGISQRCSCLKQSSEPLSSS